MILVSRTNHHLFQPLLYQLATGILSEGEIASPTRMLVKDQANVTVQLGEVTSIDLADRTVTSVHRGHTTLIGYDSLIVSAGARQSYFGNDHFAEHAPGLKTIDDALELRGRILTAFDQAELTADPVEREKLLTFVVVGAGPTGVELAGQIAGLAHRTLVGAYQKFDTRDARILLLDAASDVLPRLGGDLGAEAAEASSASASRSGWERRSKTSMRTVSPSKTARGNGTPSPPPARSGPLAWWPAPSVNIWPSSRRRQSTRQAASRCSPTSPSQAIRMSSWSAT